MAQKAKPLRRQDIEGLLVTDADAFTTLRYIRQREDIPAIPELEEKGQTVLPGIEGSLCDLYHSLWNPEPAVREEVAPDRRYWKGILEQTIKTSAYEELHGLAQFKELQSVLGTIAMGESVIALVPKEDQEKLRELNQVQQEANEMQQQADQAQANADAANQLAQAAEQQAAGGEPAQQGQPANGQSQAGQGQSAPGQMSQSPNGKAQSQSVGGFGQMTPEQAKALASQLAQDAAKAQAEAETANELADEARTKAESLAENLLGKPGTEQAEQKLRELARIGLQAARNAQAKVEEISQTVEAWGLEEGELYRQGISETMTLLERMKRSEALKKFAGLLGRIRIIAAKKAKSKIAGQGARVAIPETGRDIRRAVSSELAALVNPALRVKALQRWARGELRLRGEKTKQKLGHGPVIVCEDGSGSMEGVKQQWAKAVTLSLAHYAKLQKRSFGWMLFDYNVKKSNSYPQGRLTAEQMLELAESRSGGGTNFEAPLRKAIEMIQKQGLKKADICLITDGECAVPDQFLRELKAVKKALEINIITVLCNVGSSTDKTVREFSDSVEKVSDFTAEEAEKKIFAHF